MAGRPVGRGGQPRGRGLLIDALVLVGAFAAASALAGLLGAANLGTVLSFGQLAFAPALLWVLLGSKRQSPSIRRAQPPERRSPPAARSPRRSRRH